MSDETNLDDQRPRGRPPRPPRVLPNLGLAEAVSADDGWRRIVRALDEGKITIPEALDLVRIVEKRLPLVDAEQLRRELALVRARQLEQHARLAAPTPAAKATVTVPPTPDRA